MLRHRLLPIAALAAGLFAWGGLAKAAEATPPEVVEARKEALEKERSDTRASLARFSDPAAGSRLPEGIDPSMLAERVQDLDQLSRAVGRQLSLLESIRGAERDLAAAKATEQAWTGFKEDPPYSMLWADDLAKRLALLDEKKSSYHSSLALFGRSLDAVEKEAPAIIAAKDAAVENLAKADKPTDALQWLVDAAGTKHELVVARADALRANIALLQLQLEIVESDTHLLENEMHVVRRNVHFSDDDLEKLQNAAAARVGAIHKEVADTQKKIRDAQTQRTRAQADEEKLPQGAVTADAEATRLKLTAAETRLEVLQFVAENLASLESVDGFIATAYQNRRTLAGAPSKQAREAAMQSLTNMRDRVAAWEVVAGNELAAVNADLEQHGAAASALPADDPRVAVYADLRGALWQKQNFLQRITQATGDLRKSLSRWVDENTEVVAKTFSMRVDDALLYAKEKVRQVWDIEVSRYEETTPTGGKIERKVVLGTVIKALLFFGIAYFIAAGLSRRVQRLFVRRIHIGEAQANTLRTWMMIVIGICLAIATLNFLSIPLTLFAFFGGALAIGLGFGTQTLIKNFISGIIVLFERRIRVGDVVDIGGMEGSIIEINTRSSVLRGGDGRESLVPNSVFLENTITNLTLSNRMLRRAVQLGVGYGSSPQHVIEILEDCADRHGLIMKEPKPQVIFQDFGDNALLFKLYFWVTLDGKTNAELVESDLRLMIEKRFGEAGIGFPFPQRDVHLKLDPATQITVASPPSQP